MPKEVSAGLLVFRRRPPTVEFLLVHPGGPFWRKRDEGAWSIPKGLVEPGEEGPAAAAREFEEEVGQPIAGDFLPLTPRRQKSGKLVHAWMVEAELDLSALKSNLFEMEWPPRSGRLEAFPEVDRAAYFPPVEALAKILPGQQPIVREALERLGVGL